MVFSDVSQTWDGFSKFEWNSYLQKARAGDCAGGGRRV